MAPQDGITTFSTLKGRDFGRLIEFDFLINSLFRFRELSLLSVAEIRLFYKRVRLLLFRKFGFGFGWNYIFVAELWKRMKLSSGSEIDLFSLYPYLELI